LRHVRFDGHFEKRKLFSEEPELWRNNMLIAFLSRGCVKLSSFCMEAMRKGGASQTVYQCEAGESKDNPGKKQDEPEYDAFGDRIIALLKMPQAK
jgi:hypothetical protein